MGISINSISWRRYGETLMFPLRGYWFWLMLITSLLRPCLAATSPDSLGGPRITWSPLFDQAAQSHVETDSRTWLGNPDFTPGQTLSQTRDKIHRALVSAHEKGVRILDIQFIVNPGMLQDDYAKNYTAPPYPPVFDATLSGMAHSNVVWLEGVETFNRSHPRDPLQIKLRLNATAASLYYVFRTLKPYKTFLARESFRDGITRSRFPDLPYDPCFEKMDPSDSCFRTSPVPGDYYRTRQENGKLNNAVANLANPAVREAIAEWTRVAIQEASKIIGPTTVIQEVSLSLDAGSESSLFPGNEAMIVSFSNAAYAPTDGLPARKKFFDGREALLKATYQGFAEAVHGSRNRNGSPIKAGIFQQAWAMDGRARGTFDLYSLLKGTGIDVLHHTQMPMDSARSLMAVAFSAGIAAALGIEFDTEFSWAHFGGGWQLLYWEPSRLTEKNARMFFQQACAASRYGSKGFTYANWTMNEFLSPPPGSAWERIIGGRDRNRVKKNAAALRQSLIEARSGAKPARQLPMRALFISSVGRMECEEKAAHREMGGNACDLQTYFDWFRKFGLWDGKPDGAIWNGRVVILTDGMLQDGKPDLRTMAEIFMPFETSGKVDSATFYAMQNLPEYLRSRFKWQLSPGSYDFAGLKEWENKTQVVR